MAEQASALSYPVRAAALAKYGGQMFLIISVLTLVPSIVSAAFTEFAAAWHYLIVIAILTAGGYGLSRFRAPETLQYNEAMVLTAIMFLTAPLVMVYPFTAAGLGGVDAFFEAVSGVTTTGLTMLSDIKAKPAGLLFARAWLQWYGGLGIVVISAVLILRPGTASRKLTKSEGRSGDMIGGAKVLARTCLLVYGSLTVAAVVLFLIAGAPFFHAILYAFAAVSTGGFAPDSASLGPVGRFLQAAVIFMCLTGAVPLLFYYQLERRQTGIRPNLYQVIAIVTLGAMVTAALFAVVSDQTGWKKAQELAADIPLLAFSAQTTAGFSTTSVSHLPSAAKIVLVAAMVIGGGLGSTAGGIKVQRLLIGLRALRLSVYRSSLSQHAVLPERYAGRRLEKQEVQNALLIMLLFGAVVFISWVPFVAAGYGAADALFDVTSATGTVGLSAGVVGATLPAYLKFILIADMLLGRLEILVWLVLLAPETWVGTRR